MKVLVSITTTTNANWRKKIKETKKLGLTEVALFVSAIGPEERQEVYTELKKAKIKNIPFVHIRSDMPPAELQFLIDEFGAKCFNIHSEKEFPLKYDLSGYKNMIYQENGSGAVSMDDEVGDWAGLCLDVSHHENCRLTNHPFYFELAQLLDKYPVGIWHLNAITEEQKKDLDDNRLGFDNHFFKKLKEFDYCLRYKKYLPLHYIALELENDMPDQLRAKEYVEQLLKL